MSRSFRNDDSKKDRLKNKVKKMKKQEWKKEIQGEWIEMAEEVKSQIKKDLEYLGELTRSDKTIMDKIALHIGKIHEISNLQKNNTDKLNKLLKEKKQ